MINKPTIRLAGLVLLILFIALPSVLHANPVVTDNTQVQLISEVKAVQAGQPFWVALRMTIREGWHTYWRNPGDTGMLSTLDWSLPAGFTAEEIQWPYPERIVYGELINYGYHGLVHLLVRITPPDQLAVNEPVALKVDAKWLVCADICIPEQAQLTLEIPVSETTPPFDEQWMSAFAKTRQLLPKTNPWTSYFTTTENDLRLQVITPGWSAGRVKNFEFFPFEEGIFEYAAPQTPYVHDKGFTLTIERGAFRNIPLERVQGVLVLHVEGENEHMEAFRIDALPLSALVSPAAVTLVQQAAPPPAANDPVQSTRTPVDETGALVESPEAPLGSLKKELFLAFLGGLILNFMPCVFPILSIKALSLIDKSRKAPWQVRRHGLVFTAGVLSCFAIIAGLLIALRAGGAQIGWGFQLQSPIFVTLLAYLMFAVGLSLSGAFAVGGSLMGLGSGLAARGGYSGSFFTGVLATLVATPCSAPFMGAALGFALTQPWPVALSIFQALGVGLAFPYLVMSFFPAVFKYLPKPGTWMVRFKEFLAFAMYGTTVWLVWVLTLQTGPAGIAAALTGLVAIAFAAWLFSSTRELTRHGRLVGNVATVITVVVALSFVGLPVFQTSDAKNPTATQQNQAGQGPVWEPFSRQRLAELRAAGRPVFINFTAAWCITCLVNERVALSSARLAAVFAEKGIVYLKADWTNYDPEITQVLSEFGRSGVPLYVYYAEGTQAEPIILSQLLTEAVVLQELGLFTEQLVDERVYY
ncbi:MAG: protein-disulfide reductase DsbD domain-containing protein [Candidatus Competibacteraceae bacterium]|jgi:thiol:disulfide interchange protein DsbD|nr:protein-disulfide reductase DsbD domain-containing protein [Candidatus Competibacteraceae bacterium]